MARIRRIIRRRLTTEEQARVDKARQEIEADLPAIMTDSRRVFAHKARLRELCLALRAAREAQGVSQNELAARTGIHKSSLSKLEAGAYLNPTCDTLMRYASAIGKSIYVTLGDDPPRKGARPPGERGTRHIELSDPPASKPRTEPARAKTAKPKQPGKAQR